MIKKFIVAEISVTDLINKVNEIIDQLNRLEALVPTTVTIGALPSLSAPTVPGNTSASITKCPNCGSRARYEHLHTSLSVYSPNFYDAEGNFHSGSPTVSMTWKCAQCGFEY